VSQDRSSDDWGEGPDPERARPPESDGALDPSVEEFVSSGAADAAAEAAAAEAEASEEPAAVDPVQAAGARRAARRGSSEPRSEPQRSPVSRGRSRSRNGAVQFVRECIAELRRVQWPDRVHLWQATAVVLVTVAVVGVYLYGLDSVFKQASSWLINKQAG
jgi:preprotein translocase subunit SecE